MCLGNGEGAAAESQQSKRDEVVGLQHVEAETDIDSSGEPCRNWRTDFLTFRPFLRMVRPKLNPSAGYCPGKVHICTTDTQFNTQYGAPLHRRVDVAVLWRRK